MSRLISMLTLAIAIFQSGPLNAAGPGFTSAGVITDYYTDANQTGITIPGLNNPMGCPNSNNYILSSSAANYSAMTAAALTAYSSGSQIRFYVTGCDSTSSSMVSAVSLHRS